MKCCENCGVEIVTRDGDNLCLACQEAEGNKKTLRNARARSNRKAREDAMRSCGLVKVRGALGGNYWE